MMRFEVNKPCFALFCIFLHHVFPQNLVVPEKKMIPKKSSLRLSSPNCRSIAVVVSTGFNWRVSYSKRCKLDVQNLFSSDVFASVGVFVMFSSVAHKRRSRTANDVLNKILAFYIVTHLKSQASKFLRAKPFLKGFVVGPAVSILLAQSSLDMDIWHAMPTC